MFMITESVYMLHTHGTKFYEMVLFEKEGENSAVLIKRYGPVGDKDSGRHGQIKIESGTNNEMGNAFQATLIKKNSIRDGGRYNANRIGIPAIHNELGKKFGHDSTPYWQHYGQGKAFNYLDNWNSTTDENSIIEEGLNQEIKPPRDANWGSW
ncbi:WGR domain-containing protein [Undibacterium sp. RTI2.1]|uniref:hypothetical protein n=1 Tax=unclassified Undibacterium TaxID=2630295 RepID=UPI002B22BCD4|nr:MULTISPECIES: hypothetical protein [unclassified Undibacterium]MEB0029239.1 WGR domain-containing protein [Undibacterium sp. RTI2.1]MEB0115547.1 WGR domain-containing protein [Undibacterium sp. RTI2.2]